MMIYLIEQLLLIDLSWWVHTSHPAQTGKYILLIHDDPMLYTIAKMLKQDCCIANKVIYNLAAFPTMILVFQCLWHIPMIDCNHRNNVICQKLIDQIIVELQAFLIHLTISIRDNT